MIIIDVGAHTGEAIALPYAQDPNNQVYAIEPIPELAAQLRSHQLPNLHVFEMAMGAENTQVPFHINQSYATSSILSATCINQWQDYAEQLQTIKTIEVPVMRLDRFMEQQGIIEVELLKIDAQGYDLQVLSGAGDAIHCVKKILVETQLYPLYDGSGSKAAIVEYLTSRGFYLAFASPQTAGLEENLEFTRVDRYPLNAFDPASTARPDPFKARVPHVGILATPTADLVGQLLEQGIFEGPEQAFLWLYLRAGDVFFDCGAHTGLFSAIAAQCVGSQGQIVGFEPNPPCFELYQLNLKHSGCQNFTALNVGLSDRSGWGDLLLGKPGMSAFSTFAAAHSHPRLGTETISVKQCCLDDVVAELHIESIALTKMDVEGWEAFVLQGASQSIKAQKFPIWMIEFTEINAVAAGSSTQALRALLESFGYTLCRFDVTRLRLIPEPFKPTYPYENLFAVMNLDAANQRLATANITMAEVAKDVITRWDAALLTAELRGQITHDRQVAQDLRQQVAQLTAKLEQPQVDAAQLLHQTAIAAAHIKAMESSKFWQLRTMWFRVKRLFIATAG